MQNEKLKEFFGTHPEIDEIHVADGVLFIDKKNADAFLKSGEVETFTREAVEGSPEPEEKEAEDIEEQKE